jgi:ABC-2 type transport system ATP-binding protein
VPDAIRLRDVTKRFSGLTAVDRLTLSVPTGSIYGFIGPNGSGKTTTLRMIMNILLPDEGSIAVLDAATSTAARDRVSYLPEERGLYKKMTVRRLLRYYGQLKGCSIAQIDPAIDDWMARLGMDGWSERKIETLSKGMSQKVQFVAAVVSRPELLILDEPFSGLDSDGAELLDRELAGMHGRRTLLVATHDPERVAPLATGRLALA